MNLIKYPQASEWPNILARPSFNNSQLLETVRAVLNDVRVRGDQAVKEYELKFDKVELSSLQVTEAEIAAAENKSLRFCFIDLYNVRTEEEFYQVLAQEVLRASSSKWDELIENTKKFMGQLFPKLSYSPEPNSEFAIGLDWQEQLYKLAEEICTEEEALESKILHEKNII